MAKTLTLLYRREGADLSTGGFYTTDETKHVIILVQFQRLTYGAMMRALATYIQSNDYSAVFTQRTDREMLPVQQMSAEEFELFKADPAAAIRRRIIPVQEVNLRDAQERPPLRAGLETLADAFGDNVYVRGRTRATENELECPGCGTWSVVNRKGRVPTFDCKKCRMGTTLVDFSPTGLWVGITVEELFETGVEQFFLPRAWNTYGNWISRDNLNVLYLTYLKEKIQ
jgi:hypothetical protein